MSFLQAPITSKEALQVVEEWEEQISSNVQDLLEVLRKIDERDDMGNDSKRRLRMLTETLISRLSSEIESYRIEKIDLTGKNILSPEDVQYFEKMNKRYLRLQAQIEELQGKTLGLEDLSSKSRNASGPRGILKKATGIELSQRGKGLDTTSQSRDPILSTRSRRNSKGEELRGYMEETFSHRMAKNARQAHIKSPTRSSSRSMLRDRSLERNKLVSDLNSEWVDNLLKKFGSNKKKPEVPPPDIISSRKKRRSSNSEGPSDGIVLLMNEINALNTICNTLSRKIDTHTHPEYDNELEKIKIENSKITADFKLLQKENADIIRKINRLKSKFDTYRQRNEEILSRLRENNKENTVTGGKGLHERPERQIANESSIANSSMKSVKPSNPSSQAKQRFLLEYPEGVDRNLR
eukprot:TRINITY_DN1650_c0_g1_i1.p1 TRINITY_DN1650_c0_g1~~TRINITY_DN1650_c0_g1_i1.p1  ORF type:complete len:409 (-),score=61.45 TRINITY_DN1650_c0_g1_i1:121-1347(-)